MNRLAALARVIKARFLLVLLALLSGLHLSACSTMTGFASNEPEQEEHRDSGKTYKVAPGDTLYSLSFKAGLDYKQVAAWNGIKPPYTIYVGQVLRMSAPGTKKPRGNKPESKGTVKNKSRPDVVEAPDRASDMQDRVKLGWIWPTEGRVVSQFSSGGAEHDGIRIAGKENQPIVAAESGDVVYVGSGLVGYGRLIIIKHNNNYLSAYGLNNKLFVEEGNQVKKGQKIAEMGLSNSGVPMLHFEIRVSGKPTNPMSFLPK